MNNKLNTDGTRDGDFLVSDPIYKPSHYQLEDGTHVRG